MKPAITLAAILLSSCASWRPTPEAKATRAIASRLDFCLRSETVGWGDVKTRASCYCEAEARCALAGLPDDCGETELYLACVTGPRPGACEIPAPQHCRVREARLEL